MQYQSDLDEINTVIRKYGLKAEFRNDGWQIYIRVRNGTINYYPSTNRWHNEKRKLYYGKEHMLTYIVNNIERFTFRPQSQVKPKTVRQKPTQKKGKMLRVKKKNEFPIGSNYSMLASYFGDGEDEGIEVMLCKRTGYILLVLGLVYSHRGDKKEVSNSYEVICRKLSELDKTFSKVEVSKNEL